MRRCRPGRDGGGAAAVGPPAAASPARPGRERLTPPSWLAMMFLLPALVLLGFLVVYPIVYSVIRSLFDASGDSFVGVDNYTGVFKGHDNLVAVRNTAIWVVVAPTVVTVIGLLFAVLTERIRWATVFKLVVFMPMAISFLASGVIFRLVYQQDPDKGVANAAMVAIHDTFAKDTTYPGAGPRSGGNAVVRQDEDGSVSVVKSSSARPERARPAAEGQARVPAGGRRARRAAAGGQAGAAHRRGLVRLHQGRRRRQNVPNAGESGLPGIKVEVVQNGKVVAEATTKADGTFTMTKVPDGLVTIRLPKDNFTAAYRGAEWLGGTLITPAIIGSYLWVWSGFAMVLIAAGLAAIPRDALEAARVDGATEWQVFRRVTIPLLAPVLMVVLVTLVINVLKVFDLVYIIGGGDPDASVLALQMWTESFGGGNDQGAGSAIAVLLFVLVLPAMLFNIRRLRQERS
ncbi:carbohydrate ABC transporter permease [Actinomadura madurae]|uniref:carbohydrate ABC transporter permease n=1 Tax=Actinomadura madurae TaxID=1993 RepID=UPI0020D2305D|nr:sugar ABC transporter permease [Actinomadura madurae]MCP9977037.1 sugar ABC transporter permease [Actinomadura madurae]